MLLIPLLLMMVHESESQPSVRARFVAQEADDVFQVEVTQGETTARCSTSALTPESCELALAPGRATIKVSGAHRFTFSFDYPAGLTVHRLNWRSRWPIYVGAGLVAAGIAAIGLGASYAVRCQNGDAADRAFACGGTADVGFAIGGVLVPLGILSGVLGFIFTGNTTQTERLASAFVPRLMLNPSTTGAYAHAAWHF